jgi:hypothetical protein
MQSAAIRMRPLIVLLLALSFAGCSKQDSPDKVAKSIDSWRATLQFVADARLAGKVGTGFATKTTEAAIEELTKQSAAPSLPRALTVRAEKVIGAAGALRRAVESDDAAGIIRARRALAAEPAEFK